MLLLLQYICFYININITTFVDFQIAIYAYVVLRTFTYTSPSRPSFWRLVKLFFDNSRFIVGAESLLVYRTHLILKHKVFQNFGKQKRALQIRS